ncbi:MAG TPA: hypothetical protein PLQ56_13305 [Aggregatilineales bacterium]|nr:hypothetical protein [Aggregatilineales bacterium]
MAKRRTIRGKAIARLLNEPGWIKQEEWSALLKPRTIFVNADGRLLDLVLGAGFSEVDRYGFLFADQDEIATIIARLKDPTQKRSAHILEGLMLYQMDFTDHLAELIAGLENRFNLKPGELDYSPESVSRLQRRAKRYGRKACLDAVVFSGLVAYLGEMMRRSFNGQWHMRPSVNETDIWEPWIVDSEGRECNPFSYLYSGLSEDGVIDLPGVLSEAGRRRLPPSQNPLPTESP